MAKKKLNDTDRDESFRNWGREAKTGDRFIYDGVEYQFVQHEMYQMLAYNGDSGNPTYIDYDMHETWPKDWEPIVT